MRPPATRKLFLILFFVAFVLALAFWIHKSIHSKPQIAKIKKNPYCYSVPIVKLSSVQTPCIMVEVENQSICATIDLGFQGDIEAFTDLVKQIQEKKYLHTRSMYGCRGTERKEKVYSLPCLKIGPMYFTHYHLQETTRSACKESILSQNGNILSSPEDANLGWELFYKVNLLLDFKNSRIAFSDRFETLQKEGYFPNRFVKVPLLLERGIVEIEVHTHQGFLRCMLDTGCTWNILNTDLLKGQSLEQMAWDPENLACFPSLEIKQMDFGPIEFHRFPIQIPIHIDAILGMEFLKNKVIFLDFENRSAYFAL